MKPSEPIHYARIHTAIGPLLLARSTRGICGVHFDRGTLPQGKHENWIESDAALRECARQLEEYFAGQRRTFEVELDLRGTDFQQRCWRELLRIPFGETRSYAQLARTVGAPQGFRAVGAANGANPVAIIVPCHRVIASDGTLGGYGGGLPLKQRLLELEGALPSAGSATLFT